MFFMKLTTYGEWTGNNKFRVDTQLDQSSESKLQEHYWRKIDRFNFEWAPPKGVMRTPCPTQICHKLSLRQQVKVL
jgi:hypothetical protein